MKRLGYVLLGLAVFLAACNSSEAPGFAGELSAQAEDTYIVVLAERPAPGRSAEARARAVDVARGLGLAPRHAYGAAIVGFAAEIPSGRLNAVRRNPNVAYVEPVVRVAVSAQTVPTGVARIHADEHPGVDIDGSDDVRTDVDVAVIDTGIDFEHPDLNVVGGVDCTQNSYRDVLFGNVSCVAGGDDDHYHGTHVAGTVAALDNGFGVVGVAPGARLWAVKVLDSSGSGYTSEIIAGIDWVTDRGDIEVINMSLGGAGTSQASDDAITAATNAGITVVVAAGNDASNADAYTPANSPDAFTVSALADFDGEAGGNGSPTCRSDEDDTFANFSNYGDAVDIIAPGVCILSTYPLERGEYASISGTSMASPHVAGAAALLASTGMSVSEIKATLTAEGSSDWNSSDDGDSIKEPLLDVSGFDLSGGDGDDGGGGGSDPTSIGLSVSGYKVKGRHTVDLSWSGAAGTSVVVFRNSVNLISTANDGNYTDATGGKGGGSYVYRICEVDMSACSADVTVTF